MRDLISNEIIEYVKSHDEDDLWRMPIVGFASLEEIYKQKDILDPAHVMPGDVMEDAGCVISYFVPFRKEVNDSNKCKGSASPLWAEAYEKTNAMFVGLNEHIIEVLKTHGYKGIVPEAAFSFDDEKLIAYWSQRHIAYAAGLGTFGINNMLITDRGCSGRFNSVVTNLDVDTDEPVREERCLYKKNGSCGVCVIKCPGKALTKDEGFNRKACYGECLKNAAFYSKIGGSYGRSIGSEVCGKCISLSPCAFK